MVPATVKRSLVVVFLAGKNESLDAVKVRGEVSLGKRATKSVQLRSTIVNL